MSGSTATATNDLMPTTLCTGSSNPGRDRVYRLTVPGLAELTATVTPSGFDAALYFIAGSLSACQAVALGTTDCTAGKDLGLTGSAETLSWRNPSGNATDVYVVVDGYTSSAQGAYTLTATVGAGSDGGVDAGTGDGGLACVRAGYRCLAGDTCCNGGACVNGMCSVNSCAGVGGFCLQDAECCTGTCNSSSRVCYWATCQALGATCAYSTDCCSTQCRGGWCSTASCKALGASCASNAECCADAYCNALGRCASVQSCSGYGESCGSGCCYGLTCSAGSVPTCEGGTCRGAGATCTSSTQCCYGLSCSQGTCSTTFCAGKGEVCSGSPCCNGLTCDGQYCAAGDCTPTGYSCVNHQECCSNTCSRTGVCG